MRMNRQSRTGSRAASLLPAIVLLALLLAAPVALAGGPMPDEGEGNISDVLDDGRSLYWRMLVEHEAVVLTLNTPCGPWERYYKSGEEIVFSPGEELHPDSPDGTYTWQVRIVPVVSPDVREALQKARETGDDELVADLRRKGLLPKGPFIQTGSFTVQEGGIVARDAVEEGTRSKLEAVRSGAAGDLGGAAAATGDAEVVTAADVVYNDDVIIQRSLCVGFDCVNGESFSFDTIRLKENNLRIKFEDTSGGSFPSRDWEIEANSSSSGGQSHFRINDVDGARSPFTIVAGAPSHSLHVSSSGRVGLRTSTPILDLHVSTSNTPAIRLEQTSAGGFTAQTWDIAGNEANFFVRDVTGGSRLPFRIRPGAGSNSLMIDADGEVGLGTLSPASRLHLANGLITIGGHTFGERASNALDIEARGLRNWIMLVDSDNDSTNSSFVVSKDGDPNAVIFHVKEDSTAGLHRSSAIHPLQVGTDATNGNGAHVTAGGVWVNGSTRASKQDIVELPGTEAVAALQELAPVKFRYLGEPDEQYLGFIAEDVPEAVAQSDRKTLSTMDIVAVLTRVLQEQQGTIEGLTGRLGELEKELEALRQPAP